MKFKKVAGDNRKTFARATWIRLSNFVGFTASMLTLGIHLDRALAAELRISHLDQYALGANAIISIIFGWFVIIDLRARCATCASGCRKG